MRDMAAEPPGKGAVSLVRGDNEPIRILVVDDDTSINDLMADTLGDLGYAVHLENSAETALEALRGSPFDLVFSDVRLPGMDGIAFSRALSEAHPSLPVVLLTGFSYPELARTALQHGATDFISKPVDLDSIAIVIERNLERQRLERQRASEQDDRMMFKVVQALAAAIDAKQSYTAEHSRRVARFAGAIGRHMQLPTAEVRSLELAAHVHDVGKIGVPDSVLNKRGKLTEVEWEAMWTHPIKGAEIVQQVEELSYVADIVRHHHERIDGRGYPDGLRGRSIPLLARIVSVCDAFECMTSDRVYRKRLREEEALRRLAEGAGAQFDSSIVDTFISLYSQRQLD